MFISIDETKNIFGKNAKWIQKHLGKYFIKRNYKLAILQELPLYRFLEVSSNHPKGLYREAAVKNRRYDCIRYCDCLTKWALRLPDAPSKCPCNLYEKYI